MNTPNPWQAHASLTVLSTAKTLAELGLTIEARTTDLLIQSVGGTVRMTINGTAPTAASGFLVADGQMIQIGNAEASAAKFIIGTGTPKLEIGAYVS